MIQVERDIKRQEPDGSCFFLKLFFEVWEHYCSLMWRRRF